MKRFINALLFFFLVLLNSHIVLSQENLNAKVLTKIVDNFINVKGIAQNNDATFKDDYSYLLFSLKKDANGKYSRNSQTGIFSLGGGEEKELAKLKINLQIGEELKVYLFLRKDSVLVSKDSAIIFSAEKLQKQTKIKESEFELKGIVIEDVVTKIGKDFHDYFYQTYSTSGNQYPFIITIKEKPYFGRSSIITIEVDDKKMHEFLSKPNEEFLRSNVMSALQNIKQYSIQRKLLFKNNRI